MFLLVSKFKMIGELLNVVHALKKMLKKRTKHITNKSYMFHDHPTLLTMHTCQSKYFPFFFLPKWGQGFKYPQIP